MSVEVTPPSGAVTPLPASPLTLPGQGWGVVLLLVGFFCLYGPTYAHLAVSTWATDEQGHGPLIVAASAWLLWTARGEIFAGPARPALGVGFGLLAFGLLCFMVGRSQSVIELEAGSQVIVLASGLLILHGWGALKRAWFPILFLLFSVPLPGALVQAITMPLKHAVSVVAEKVLYLAGYPIGRSGVMLVIGPYQLLAAVAGAWHIGNQLLTRWLAAHPNADTVPGGLRGLLTKVRHALLEPAHHHPLAWFFTAANWSLKLAAGACLLSAISTAPWGTAWSGALGGELAAIVPLQGPAGFGTYEAGVWAGFAAHLPRGSAALAQAIPAALALHVCFLLCAVLAGAIASLLNHIERPATPHSPASSGRG